MSKAVALPRRGAVLAALAFLVLAMYPVFSMLWSKTFSSTPPRADSGPPPETADEEPTGPLWWYPWGLGQYKLNPAPEFVDPPSAAAPSAPPPPPPPHSETLRPYVLPHQNNWDDDKALAKATEEADEAPPPPLSPPPPPPTTTKGSSASSIKKNAVQGFRYPWGKGNESDHLEPPAASSSSSSSSLSQSPAWCVEGSVGWGSPADLGRGACKPAIAANPDPVKRRCDPKTYQPARGEGGVASFAYSFVGQSREDRAVLNRYYCQKRNGTYVEVGALDGLRYSNTLFLEKALGWSGVLIEGQPDSAQLLARNRPGNDVIQKAVCPDGTRGTVRFYGGRKHTRAGIAEHLRPDAREGYASSNKPAYEVPCQPFHAMLAAAGFGRGGRRGSVIDFASVDIEGAEHIVLETMDYRIAVRVWLIELFEEDEESRKKAKVVASLLESHGYRRSPWDIREYCKQLDPTGPLRRVMTGRLCTTNVMFEHPDLVH